MFIAALIEQSKYRNTLKCPSVNERIKKSCVCVYRGILLCWKREMKS